MKSPLVGFPADGVGVGSRRYKVTFSGPGGHSFGAFGLANPIGAMGRAIAKIEEMQVPKQPKTTFNVGRIEGGASINAIPGTALMDVDLRSSSEDELRRLPRPGESPDARQRLLDQLDGDEALMQRMIAQGRIGEGRLWRRGAGGCLALRSI